MVAFTSTIAAVAQTLPRNSDVADQLELLADLLELTGEASFRVIAYRRAAQRVRENAGSIAQLALDGRAKELPGIGKTIEEKIVQIVDTGEIAALTKRKAEAPQEVVEFMRLPGARAEDGGATLARARPDDARRAEDRGGGAAAEGDAGAGARSEEKILKALAEERAPADVRPLLGKGLPAVLAVVEALRESPLVDKVSEAGSVRRRRETFRDLDVIATSSDPAALTAQFVSLPFVLEVVAHGDTKATVLSNDGLRFDLRVVPPESFGNLLQHFTG